MARVTTSDTVGWAGEGGDQDIAASSADESPRLLRWEHSHEPVPSSPRHRAGHLAEGRVPRQVNASYRAKLLSF